MTQSPVPFSQPGYDVWIHEGLSSSETLAGVTHLAIGAHADDLEFMAYHGVAECYDSKERSFAGVVLTDGRGSARTGVFADYTDDEMVEERKLEQVSAAKMGRYGAMFQLAYSSAAVKEANRADIRSELRWILEQTKPDVLYLHNPFDRHPTHIAVLHHCLEVLMEQPESMRPKRVLGCEVWRDLDWLSSQYRVELAVDAYPELAMKLAACFQSQIAGGKRYDLAVEGRRRAHATFGESHQVDQAKAVTLAVDMSSWLNEGKSGIASKMNEVLEAFRGDVRQVWQGYVK